MTEKRTCPDCGAELAADVPSGLCPQCLFRRATATKASGGPLSPEAATVIFSEASAPPTTPPELGKIRYFGDYELLEEIARGGMGVVYKARQCSLNRLVALKMILSGVLAGKKEVERFHAEAEAAANLSHPNIVPIYEIGQHQGQHYFSMELVEGGTLTGQMARLSQDLPAAIRLLAKVARAVHHAHQRGILHRDLKPGNILIDTQGEPRVTDFGLAKRVETESDLSVSGAVLGTPGYMPPEQALGRTKQLTTAADVYSLGAILYELLTGRTPFQAESAMEMLRKIVEQEPPRPSSIHPRIDRDLETICLKCLEKDPQRRYGSSEALAQELERWIRNEPIEARPSSPWERIVKWVMRKPAIAALSAATLLAVISGAAGVTWQWQQARQSYFSLQIQRAQQLLEGDDSATGLALLANVVRRDSGNRVAATRLLAALTQRSFPSPIGEPLETGRYVRAKFNSSGENVITASGAGRMRVWNSQTGQLVGEPFKPQGGVLFFNLMRDQDRLLIVLTDKTTQIHDIHTGQLSSQPFKLDENGFYGMLSPAADRLLSFGADTAGSATFRLWDTALGRPLAQPFKYVETGPFEFSPDGQFVVIPSGATAQIFDARTGQPVGEPVQHKDRVAYSAFSPNGKQFLTASYDKTAQRWDLDSRKALGEPMRHDAAVTSARFSPDGQLVVTASSATALVWDTQTGQRLGEALKHKDRILYADFSQDGQYVVTTSWDMSVRVWHAQSGQPAMEPIQHRWEVGYAPLNQGMRQMLTEPFRTTNGVQIWKVTPGGMLARAWSSKGGFRFAQFSPDNRRFIGTSFDGSIQIWDALDGRLCGAMQHPEGERLLSCFDRTGLTVLSHSSESVRLWDTQTGKLLGKPIKHKAEINLAAFSPDGKRIVTASSDGTAQVWDVRSGTTMTEPLTHSNSVVFAEFSPNGRRIVTASYDHTARVWDSWTGRSVGGPLVHETGVVSAHFSPNGRKILTVAGHAARLWSSRTGKLLTVIEHNDIGFARFSPSGARVVTAGNRDFTVRIWDARTGQPLAQPLKHHEPVRAQFSADGQRVLTFSGNSARVWDTRTGFLLTEPFKHNAFINSAEFSADGQWIITASSDGTARIWEVPDAIGLAPKWLSELAECVAQRRSTGLAEEPVPLIELSNLKDKMKKISSPDYYQRWADWFLADRTTRSISPSSRMSVPEFVRRRIEDNTLESLQESIRLSPANGWPFALLAQKVLEQDTKENPRRTGEADFYSRHAVELLPNDPEVRRIRAEVLERISKFPTP